MLCHGCGGVLGLDCFNPQECEQITQQMAVAYQFQQAGPPTPVEASRPECPHCGCEFAPPPIVDGERYPPVFAKHNCECGYTFESERVVRYISRPMEERKWVVALLPSFSTRS